MIFYFSGTGNSKWIANQLSKEQKEELVFIPDALKNRTFEFCLREDEKIGFVFPVYSWAPPEIVLNFIRQLSLKGYKRQYLFFGCSCGDDTGLTQQVLEKALSHKGWKCHAGFSVTMPNNYVLLPGFDVDKKELEKKKTETEVKAQEEPEAEEVEETTENNEPEVQVSMEGIQEKISKGIRDVFGGKTQEEKEEFPEESMDMVNEAGITREDEIPEEIIKSDA